MDLLDYCSHSLNVEVASIEAVVDVEEEQEAFQGRIASNVYCVWLELLTGLDLLSNDI